MRRLHAEGGGRIEVIRAECGHWRATYCNADSLNYCGDHYPEGLR